MVFTFCPNCNAQRGFKRKIGWGTFFAIILTFGLWFLAIPFYPKRCITCGLPYHAARQKHSTVSQNMSIHMPIYKRNWFIPAVVLFFIAIVLPSLFITSKDRTTNSKTEQHILNSLSPANLNEKAILINHPYLGDFRKAKIIKKKGIESLSVWEPHVQYAKSLNPLIRDVLLEGVLNLTFEYDEIWITEYDKGLTPAQKIKWKGQLDIIKMYWKDDKVQAYVVEKYYLDNPATGEKLKKPGHKVYSILDRNHIVDIIKQQTMGN